MPPSAPCTAGDYWIGGKRVVNLVSALHDLMQQAAIPQHKTYGLTPRELEVVGCIVEGCSNRDIAKQFTLSEETVKRHLSNIFDKTGVSTRLELALIRHRASAGHSAVGPAQLCAIAGSNVYDNLPDWSGPWVLSRIR